MEHFAASYICGMIDPGGVGGVEYLGQVCLIRGPRAVSGSQYYHSILQKNVSISLLFVIGDGCVGTKALAKRLLRILTD
jgi:hypothetical protein